MTNLLLPVAQPFVALVELPPAPSGVREPARVEAVFSWTSGSAARPRVPPVSPRLRTAAVREADGRWRVEFPPDALRAALGSYDGRIVHLVCAAPHGRVVRSYMVVAS